MTLDEAIADLLATTPAFAVGDAEIRGVSYRVFTNAPPHARALLQASRQAQGDGAADYLVHEDERWTYDAFCFEIKILSQVLQSRFGVGKGDPVAIAMRNAPEFLILMMATASIGAVAVLLNAWWTCEELDYALRDSKVRLVFADAPRAARIAPLSDALGLTLVGARDGEAVCDLRYSALRGAVSGAVDWPEVAIDTDDDFAVIYSSGTTGHPKGVVLTHRGAMNAVHTWLLQGAAAQRINPSEPGTPALRPAGLVVTPLFHVTATHPLFLLSLPAGAKLALMPRWDPEAAARIVEREKITRFLGVPTQSADLMEAAHRLNLSLDSLDYLGAGGAKRPAAQVAELARSFPRAQIATGWGMTETNANGIGMAGADYVARPGAVGRLYPPVQELRILGDDGHEVPVGETGEITVKSPCNMRCYLNKPDATDEVLKDGWLRTGDIGCIDAEGYVTILDRKKNIIIRGGENVACLDVEGALHRHPAVAEACAFSVPDRRFGEVVGAGIQVRPGHVVTAQQLREFLALHIARFKIPDHVWLQAEPLPRGATDKIDRRALRRSCLATLEIGDDTV